MTGTPVLTLNDGGTARYTGGSGTRSLQFTTTVLAGQNAAALAVTGVTLPLGASIRDAAGNDAVLAGAAATIPGLSVITAVASVLSVAASPGTAGSLGSTRAPQPETTTSAVRSPRLVRSRQTCAVWSQSAACTSVLRWR